MLKGFFFRIMFILKKISLLFYSMSVLFGVSALAQNSTTQNNASDLVLASQVEIPSLPKKEIKKYLSGQKPQWPDGTPIIIVLYPKGSEEMTWLCTDVLQLNENMYRRFLHQKAFRTGIQLIEVQNQEEAQALLEQHHGAVAPLNKEVLSEKIHSIDIQP